MSLLLINYEFPPLGGGGGQATSEIARQLAASGHDVTVLTTAFAGLPRKEQRGNLTIFRVRAFRRYKDRSRLPELVLFALFSSLYALVLCRKWRPQAVVAFFTVPCGIAAWLLKKIYGIPYLVSLRGGDVPGFLPELLSVHHRVTSRLIRFIWKRARAVVANSESLKDLAQKTLEGGEVIVIPNGVDTDFFQRNRSGSGPVFQLMTAGRLTPQKGVEALLRMLANIRTRVNHPFKLWIAGDGPQRKGLKGLADQLGLGEVATFLGWLDREALKGYYARADLFVLPSLEEGMSNVILEAMAMSLPILTTDVPGTRELVHEGKNGFLVSKNDWGSFEEKLVFLINHRGNLAKISDHSRALSLTFSWEKVAAGYLKLCQNPS